MHIEPRINLVFNGECDAAFTLYRECLGATVTFRLTWGDSPMAEGAPVEWQDKILHDAMTIGGTAISGGDVLPGQYEHPLGFQPQLNLDDVAEAERMFSQLADGGRVTVPLQHVLGEATWWRHRPIWGSTVARPRWHTGRRQIRSRPR